MGPRPRDVQRMRQTTVTLLLVEDNEFDVRRIMRAMSKLDVSMPLLRAADGIEAFEILERPDILQPIVILLDLNMPRMSGLEFLEVLRNDPRFEAIPVYVITTSDYRKDVETAFRFGISGYFVKPASSDEMLEITRSLTHLAKIGRYPMTHVAQGTC